MEKKDKKNKKEEKKQVKTAEQTQDEQKNVEVLQEEHFKDPEEKAEIEKLKERVKSLEEENKKYKEKVQLAQAELINYRKRKDEEVASMMKYANKDIIVEILNVQDNLERAIKHATKSENEEVKKYNEGVNMIYENLKSILHKFEVEEINRVGEIFDPNLEQALLTDSVDDKQEEEVLDVLQKGYKLKDRVIRPASVKINKKENK